MVRLFHDSKSYRVISNMLCCGTFLCGDLLWNFRLGFVRVKIDNNPVEKTNGEFDIVTWSQKGYVFYEAKFTNEPISSKVIKKEIEQVNNSGLSAIKFGFISKSGFKNIRNNSIIKITLDDLFDSKD